MEHHQFIVDFPSYKASFSSWISDCVQGYQVWLPEGNPYHQYVLVTSQVLLKKHEKLSTRELRCIFHTMVNQLVKSSTLKNMHHLNTKTQNTKPQGLTCRQFQEFTAKTTMNVWWSCFFAAQVGGWHRANTCYSCVPWSKDRIWIQTPNIMGWCPPSL